MTAPLITSTEALQGICQRAMHADRVALDTEFVWERTFYPQLGIVQLSFSEEELYLIDAVALPTLPGLGDVLASPNVQLILHDAIQDLQILCRHTQTRPQNIFDTRRAAGFAGMLSTTSLATLLSEVLDIHLPKGETRSNWLQRPLTEKQRAYALDDVRHMHALADALLKRASDKGHLDALNEEMDLYNVRDLYDDTSNEQIFRRFKGYRLKKHQKERLYDLVCWREKEARRVDRPRNAIMHDRWIRDIVQNPPKGIKDLYKKNLAPRKWLDRYASELDALLNPDPAGRKTLPDCVYESHSPLSSDMKKQLDLRLKAIKIKAKDAGIDPALIASKADITAVLLNEEHGKELPLPLRCQWRQPFLRSDTKAQQQRLPI